MQQRERTQDAHHLIVCLHLCETHRNTSIQRIEKARRTNEQRGRCNTEQRSKNRDIVVLPHLHQPRRCHLVSRCHFVFASISLFQQLCLRSLLTLLLFFLFGSFFPSSADSLSLFHLCLFTWLFSLSKDPHVPSRHYTFSPPFTLRWEYIVRATSRRRVALKKARASSAAQSCSGVSSKNFICMATE